MKTSRDFSLAVIPFLAAAVYMTASLQPVWWSVTGVALVWVVVVGLSIRAVIEYRREVTARAAGSRQE